VTIGDLATYNIETRSGSGTVGELNQPVCVNVANNVVSDPAGPNGGIFTWRARVANAAPNATLNVQGFNTNIATTWLTTAILRQRYEPERSRVAARPSVRARLVGAKQPGARSRRSGDDNYPRRYCSKS
jgi:hypothetical protein